MTSSEKAEFINMMHQIDVVDLSKLYWLIGAMIVINFGTIISFIVAVLKLYAKGVRWIADIEHGIDMNKKDVDKAHGKIRMIEERFMQ